MPCLFVTHALCCALPQRLQAPVSGSKKPAIDGQLIILAAGEKVWILCGKHAGFEACLLISSVCLCAVVLKLLWGT